MSHDKDEVKMDIDFGQFKFYYKDIYDMIEQLETDILNEFQGLIQHYDIADSDSDKTRDICPAVKRIPSK